jgi:hypothetical protein
MRNHDASSASGKGAQRSRVLPCPPWVPVTRRRIEEEASEEGRPKTKRGFQGPLRPGVHWRGRGASSGRPVEHRSAGPRPRTRPHRRRTCFESKGPCRREARGVAARGERIPGTRIGPDACRTCRGAGRPSRARRASSPNRARMARRPRRVPLPRRPLAAGEELAASEGGKRARPRVRSTREIVDRQTWYGAHRARYNSHRKGRPRWRPWETSLAKCDEGNHNAASALVRMSRPPSWLRIVLAVLVLSLGGGSGTPGLVRALAAADSHVCTCASGGSHAACPVCNPMTFEKAHSRHSSVNGTPCGETRTSLWGASEPGVVPAASRIVEAPSVRLRSVRALAPRPDTVVLRPATPPPRFSAV